MQSEIPDQHAKVLYNIPLGISIPIPIPFLQDLCVYSHMDSQSLQQRKITIQLYTNVFTARAKICFLFNFVMFCNVMYLLGSLF